jgi:hypothetical protein
LSLLPIPAAKRTERTGGKTPEEEAPEGPDVNAPDEENVQKHTSADSNYSSRDAGNLSGSDTSIGSDKDDEDPGEEFDERELGDCGDLESINCHDETETWTPILSLSESVSYATLF